MTAVASAEEATASAAGERPPPAWAAIGSAAATAAVLLAATNGGYGYHRDELYFRMLEPGWGYVDQPPLTPFLARAATAVLGDTVWAMRVPAVLCVAVAVVLTALTTRELGGRTGAQALAAWGFAFAALPLASGHLMSTATVDLAVWAAVLLMVVRTLQRDEPRWWLAIGAATGLCLYNKHLIVLLLVSLGVALLAVGPRRVLRTPWLWAGVGIALLVGAPNLVYQATHGWPQLAMASAIAESKGPEARVMLLPFQAVLLGPPLVAVWVAGIVALLRRPQWRPIRALAVAYPVMLVVVWVTGGQTYYPLGLVAVLYAAGCVPVADWVRRRRTALRRTLVVAAVALNAVVAAVVALPLLPPTTVGDTPIPAMNQTVGDQIGWPEYTRQVADVYRSLSPADAANAVIITGNYGEAGALHRYGPRFDLPAVYSGHNELHRYGPPPAAATVVITVGMPLPDLHEHFASCEQAATLDNGVGVDNEEQGRAIAVCRDPRAPWPQLWPEFHHYS